MAAKRKKVVLSIQDKLELIKSVESGASKKQMCLRYGIGESTVRDIMKQKDKLIEFASSSDNTSTMTRRKTMKKSTYEELDLVLLEWVSQEGEEDEDDVPLSVLANLAKSVAGGVDVNEENIVEWIECDANDPGFEHLTDENIINQVRGIESEDNEDEEEMQMQRTVTHDAALGHIDSIIQYLEEQDDASLCDKMVLRKLKSQIKIKCFSTKKQKQMTDFFVKQ